jgi:kynurenine formamidase
MKLTASRERNTEGMHSVDEIPVRQLVGPGYLVDVTEKALKNPDYQILVEDLLDWEKVHGEIPQDSIVLLRTGYGKFWPDRVKYMGTSDRGKEAVKNLHFPGLHPGAARWLVENRKIKAVGIDTPSIDFGQSENFLTHQTLFKGNVPAMENIASLDKLPQRDFILIALPMKIAGGSGAPTRIIALIPKKN